MSNDNRRLCVRYEGADEVEFSRDGLITLPCR